MHSRRYALHVFELRPTGVEAKEYQTTHKLEVTIYKYEFNYLEEACTCLKHRTVLYLKSSYSTKTICSKIQQLITIVELILAKPDYLLWLQIADDGREVVQDLLYEGLRFAELDYHEMTAALVSDLDERIAGHVLHALVRLYKNAIKSILLWVAITSTQVMTLGMPEQHNCTLSSKSGLRLSQNRGKSVAKRGEGYVGCEGYAGLGTSSRARTVHELEELVHDRLEELPVRLEEARILAHDVHDVRGDDGLIVLAALLLHQT